MHIYKFKEILEKYTNYQIIERLIELYPEEDKNRNGYIRALEELHLTMPKLTNGHIVVEDVTEDDETWTDVSFYKGKDRRYSASFIKWAEWLSIKIHSEKSDLDTFCHCLWELTWYGYSNNQTQAVLHDAVEIAEKATKEIKRREGK